MSTNDPRPTHQRFLRQLLGVFLTLSLVIGLVVPAIIFWTSWHQARIDSERTAREIVDVFANDARYALLVASRKDAETVVVNILKFPDMVSAEVIDERGERLAAGATRRPDTARRSFAIERVVTAESRGTHGPLDDGPSTPAEAIGRVRITVSLDRSYRTSVTIAYYAAGQIAVLIVLLSVALIKVSVKMLAPLADLVQVLRRNDDDTRLPPIPAYSPTEVHVIYGAIEAMRQRIADDHRQLLHYANGLEAMVSERTCALETARDEAERANRAKTLFLANVSHELRTPLQAIILHARLISGGAHQDTVRGSPDTILRASSQLLDLIDQLLNLAKAESGHALVLSYSTFAIRDTLDEAVTTIRATLSPGNALAVHCTGEAIVIVSDRTRLLQVIYNLVRNADKFTTNGRIVLMLEVMPDPAHIRLTISDDGIGIPPEQLARIFEPFFQGGAARGSVSSGIGIGLWVTKTIVDALGGRIEVSSTPGTGTTFVVDIPVTSGACAAGFVTERLAGDHQAAAVSRPGPGAARVLFAEDEAVIRAAMSQFLREAGYVVDECADGAAVFAILQEGRRPYDVIVLDHRMPGYTGLELLSVLRERLRLSVPVIILTGNDTSELREEAARYRAALIAKPVQPERLIVAIAQAAHGGVSAMP